jgi:hypothetical protein
MKKAQKAAVAVGICLSVFAGGLYGQQSVPEAKDTSAAVRQLADLGPGVHKVQKDAAGHMKACVVVGQNRISTVLGNAKGLELAQKRAKLNANAEFIKWMKSNIKAVESMTNESIVYLEGSDKALRESGKATEVTKDNVELVSQGVVRGMTLIGVHQDGAKGVFTVVFGWTPKHAVLAEETQSANVNPGSAETSVVPSEPGQAPAPIPTKTVVSDDADGFLKPAQ